MMAMRLLETKHNNNKIKLVKCSYCDSLYEENSTGVCPHCGGHRDVEEEVIPKRIEHSEVARQTVNSKQNTDNEESEDIPKIESYMGKVVYTCSILVALSALLYKVDWFVQTIASFLELVIPNRSIGLK